jgi:hypothetical protein
VADALTSAKPAHSKQPKALDSRWPYLYGQILSHAFMAKVRPRSNGLRFSCGRPLRRHTNESLPLVSRPPAANAGLGRTALTAVTRR